jgi:hypothetical protein
MTGTTPQSSSNDHYHHGPEQTELEKGLNTALTRVEPYSNQILIGFVVVALVLLAGIFWFRSSGARHTAGWDEFIKCRAPEDFLAVADNYPGLPVGEWARLQAARQFMSEGLAQALTNRETSDERLTKAKDSFDELIHSGRQPEVREESLYGLATCLEALSDGKDETAIDAYQQLLQEFPESQHRLWANERVAALKLKSTEGFYAWFRQQNPKPAERPKPQDVPAQPAEEGFPELNLPSEPQGDKTESGPITVPANPPADMSIQLPKVEGEAPKDFPAGEKPADGKPATEKTDAEKMDAKPAASKPVPESTPAATEKTPAAQAPPVPEAPAKPAETTPGDDATKNAPPAGADSK